jgi:hypothetical protein
MSPPRRLPTFIHKGKVWTVVSLFLHRVVRLPLLSVLWAGNLLLRRVDESLEAWEELLDLLYGLQMLPNIKQRGPPDEGEKEAHKRLRFRISGRGVRSPALPLQGDGGVVFGAEETDEHRLRTRFRKEENRERWGPVMAVGWNLKVLNRLRCGRILGMEVMPLIRN